MKQIVMTLMSCDYDKFSIPAFKLPYSELLEHELSIILESIDFYFCHYGFFETDIANMRVRGLSVLFFRDYMILYDREEFCATTSSPWYKYQLQTKINNNRVLVKADSYTCKPYVDTLCVCETRDSQPTRFSSSSEGVSDVYFYVKKHLNVYSLKIHSFMAVDPVIYLLYKTKKHNLLKQCFSTAMIDGLLVCDDYEMHTFILSSHRFADSNFVHYEDRTKLTNKIHGERKTLLENNELYDYKWLRRDRVFVTNDLAVQVGSEWIHIDEAGDDIATCCNLPKPDCQCYSTVNCCDWSPLYHKRLPKAKTIGFEIEVDLYDTEAEVEWLYDNQKQWYLKAEHTCETGIEIVSNPFEPSELSKYKTLFDKIENHAHQGGIVECKTMCLGTHFHFDTSWFVDDAHANRVSKWLWDEFNSADGLLYRASGRRSRSELRKYSAPTKKINPTVKHCALARRGNTYEFRFFASTIDYGRFCDMVEFLVDLVDSLIVDDGIPNRELIERLANIV